MRIFLTGFMGSGKSFVARRLAQLSGMPFIDLDDFIVEHVGQSIAQFFVNKGEGAFRQLESELLYRTAELPTLVLATGGGTACFNDNMDWMNDKGVTVFLDTPIPILYQRLRKEKEKRPLIKSLDDQELKSFIKTKRAERLPFYENAALIYRQEAEGEEVAKQIFEQLPNITGH